MNFKKLSAHNLVSRKPDAKSAGIIEIADGNITPEICKKIGRVMTEGDRELRAVTGLLNNTLKSEPRAPINFHSAETELINEGLLPATREEEDVMSDLARKAIEIYDSRSKAA